MTCWPCEPAADSLVADDVWGLISDVHGNYNALEDALCTLATAGAHKLAFLGDYLGRGESDRCVERIRELADISIVGNRDLDWQDRVAAETRGWVLSLPKIAQVGRLLITHGDSRLTSRLSTGQIGRGFPKVWSELEHRQAQVWAFGHSHFARIWRKASVDAPAQLLLDACVSLEKHAQYYVNVGTTGLPFPGKGGPSVALVDLAHGEIRQLPLSRD